MIIEPRTVAPGVVLRLATVDDAAGLARAYAGNRDHLRPWEPHRPPEFFTAEGQAVRLGELTELRRAGRMVPWVLDDERAGIVGVVNLSNIVRGAFQSGSLGYWVAAGRAGRGLGTAAVAAVCEAAAGELGMHRVEAGTVTTNTASQRVLEKCGFERFGTARDYVHIDGAWRDHYLFQRILNDHEPR
ncbi:GNAT family N-acetyltransferase [Streptomyces huiliensis]|uniref:GNAT family N-acetyltransferase n=1 Tax=Streptomyces huiliensis TaxID=2876027 RepID=UPI001CC0CF59|nr:GNAT family N-acetyltransferase [Streptomyces huiliensis]MBZ4322829.1 GNAT family N-acetyltransferase [Streptomyces huiliensis]